MIKILHLQEIKEKIEFVTIISHDAKSVQIEDSKI